MKIAQETQLSRGRVEISRPPFAHHRALARRVHSLSLVQHGTSRTSATSRSSRPPRRPRRAASSHSSAKVWRKQFPVTGSCESGRTEGPHLASLAGPSEALFLLIESRAILARRVCRSRLVWAMECVSGQDGRAICWSTFAATNRPNSPTIARSRTTALLSREQPAPPSAVRKREGCRSPACQGQSP
jgi:hypothetical protein